MSQAVLDFAHHRNPNAASDAERARLLENPGFGSVFTDHMVVINYQEGTGWHDARVVPYAPIPMDPASAVLHYAQEIFEGLKAYRLADGAIGLFRPDANARRFRQSAERLAMAQLPEDLFVRSILELVRTDAAWVPRRGDQEPLSAPFMFATEPFLGVRPSAKYLYMVIASPVGSYFKRRHQPGLGLGVRRLHPRRAAAARAAKCGGNYAASLAAQAQAYDQRLRPGGLPRRRGASLGRGAGRHERLLRHATTARWSPRRSPARSCRASPATPFSRWRATVG